MKLGKAEGPSGVVADMLRAAGDERTSFLKKLIASPFFLLYLYIILGS